MFRWYRSLYYSDRMKESPEHLKCRMDNGDFSGNCYLITLAYNGKDYLDIRPLYTVGHPYLQENMPMIVAAAASRKDAYRLVEKITQDCLQKTGDVNLRSFLDGQE